MDPKAACYRVVQDLRFLSQQFGNAKKAIQQAQQTHAGMEAFTGTKQRAVMALMALESNGWTFEQLVGGLSRICHSLHYQPGVITDIAIQNRTSTAITFPSTSTVVIGVDEVVPGVEMAAGANMTTSNLMGQINTHKNHYGV